MNKKLLSYIFIVAFMTFYGLVFYPILNVVVIRWIIYVCRKVQ